MFEKKAQKAFNIHHFTLSTCLFGFLNSAPICCVFVPFFKANGLLPLQLSIVMSVRRLSRMCFESFFGLIFDRFGAKPVFFIGKLLKLLCFLTLLFGKPCFSVFLIAMFFSGVANSTIYGKISSMIYNNLSATDTLKKFPKVLCLYHFCFGGSVATMSFIAGALLKVGFGYNFLIYVSIFITLLSCVVLYFFIPSKKEYGNHQFISPSFKYIFSTTISIIKTRPRFLQLILLSSIINFFALQFGSVSSMILLDMGWQASQIANFGAIVKLCNCFGAVLVLFLFQNGISVNICIKLVGVIIGLLLISAKTYSLPLFLCLNVFPVIIYSLIDVSVEKNFEYVSDKKIRGTAVSFSSTVASLFAVLCNLLVGFVAEINNYKTAFQVFAVIMFLLIAVIFLFELKIKNNEPENIVHC